MGRIPYELMKELTSTIPILSDNKTIEYYMLIITASEVGRHFR